MVRAIAALTTDNLLSYRQATFPQVSPKTLFVGHLKLFNQGNHAYEGVEVNELDEID